MCGMERLSNEALPVQAMVLLHPKEVPLCLTGTVSKICWGFYAGTLRRRLTRSHAIVGALAPGSEDTELGVVMEPEVGHGETEVYPRVQA